VFGHIKFDWSAYLSRFFDTKKGPEKEQILGNTITDHYLTVTEQACRGISMAAQLTSNCGRPSAVNLTAHNPVPKVAPAI
jgi:hypothetical protein